MARPSPEPPASGATAIYIRWSTDEQTGGTTLAVQRERCLLYVRSQGWVAAEDLIFVDEGHSGGSLNRPALTRLRTAVRLGQIGCVVAYSIDRLSRNLADITFLLQHEWAGRCTFRSATQPIGTDEANPTGQLLLNMLASFAEFERELIRERTHVGSLRRAREGRYPGSPVAPYGYVRVSKGTLAPDPAKAAVARQIFAWACTGPDGQGPAAIARRLNQLAIAAPGGGRWWAACVREILRNPVYAGTVAFGRRKVNPAHGRDSCVPRRSIREQPLAWVGNAVPALIEQALWERTQGLLGLRSRPGRTRSIQGANRSLLTGLVYCPCGGPLHTFRKQGGMRYYRCSHNAQAGGCSSRPGIYRAEPLESLVVGAVLARYGSEQFRTRIQRKLTELRSTNRIWQEQSEVLAQIRRRVAQVDADLGRLRRAARTGEIRVTTYEELRADGETERARLIAAEQKLAQNLASVRANALQPDRWTPVCRINLWDELDASDRRLVLCGLLRRVVVYRQRGSDGPTMVDLVWESVVEE